MLGLTSAPLDVVIAGSASNSLPFEDALYGRPKDPGDETGSATPQEVLVIRYTSRWILVYEEFEHNVQTRIEGLAHSLPCACMDEPLPSLSPRFV